eukprot:3000332-Karenia_brevis.AAC.1
MDLRANLSEGTEAYTKLLPSAVEKYKRGNDADFKDLPPERQLRLVGEAHAEEHKSHFPFNDNMFSIMFVIMSDLKDNQRFNLINQLKTRDIHLEDFTWKIVSHALMDYLNNPARPPGDPNVRKRTADPYNKRIHRKFNVLSRDVGQLMGHPGYSAIDEEDGQEGFLSEFDDEF